MSNLPTLAPCRKREMKSLRPLRAIRTKCVDCCAGSVQEVRLCPVTACPLHPYRFGRRPSKTGDSIIEGSASGLELEFDNIGAES